RAVLSAGRAVDPTDHEGELGGCGGKRVNRALVERHIDSYRLELIGRYGDDGIGLLVLADDAHGRSAEPAHAESERAWLIGLVENFHGIAVAQSTVGKPDVERIAVVQDAHLQLGPKHQRRQHDDADNRHRRGVEQDARPDPGYWNDRRAGVLQIAHGVVGDQPTRPADLVHDLVASVDAECAL